VLLDDQPNRIAAQNPTNANAKIARYTATATLPYSTAMVFRVLRTAEN